MKIGIIGRGFVGSAINNGFSCDPNYVAEIKIYDINPQLSSHSLEETVNQSEIIFLSFSTLEILENIFSKILKYFFNIFSLCEIEQNIKLEARILFFSISWLINVLYFKLFFDLK